MFKIRIVTPEGLVAQDEVSILNIVTPEGEMGILENHIPLVASLDISIISTDNGTRKYYVVGEGTCQFQDNVALILVDSCEKEEDIDERRALQSLVRAKKRISESDSKVDIDRALKSKKRAEMRLKLKEHKRDN